MRIEWTKRPGRSDLGIVVVETEQAIDVLVFCDDIDQPEFTDGMSLAECGVQGTFILTQPVVADAELQTPAIGA